MNRLATIRALPPSVRLAGVLVVALLILIPMLTTVVTAQELRQPESLGTEEPTIAVPDLPIQQELPSTPTPTTEPPLREIPTETPTETPTLGEPPLEEPGTASLTVEKRVCPPFYDPFTGNPTVDCTETLDGVTFDLDNHDAGELDLQAVTGDVVPGAAVFTDVTPGTWALSEQIPAGYDQPFLWDCVDQNAPGLVAPPFTLFNTWDLEIEAGQDILCRWFNVEDNTNHTIRVSKFVCPEGFDATSDVWTFQDQCDTPLAGVDFTMTTDGAAAGGTTDAQGRIEWTDVDLEASGQIQLDEEIPDGYGEPVVWCVSFPEAAADPEDFDFFQVASVDGLVSVSPAQNEPYISGCAYYNFLAEGGEGNTVRVIKHQCPMGVVEDAEFEDYNEICTQLFDDVAFTLEHDGGSFPGMTANGGEVEWTGVPIGEFTIRETVPAGFADPLVWCGLTPSISLPEQMPAAGGLVSGSIEAEGSDYLCHWFNIPVPTEGGEVYVVKLACPEGVAPSDDAFALGESCLEDAGAVTVQVTGPGGYAEEQATSGGAPKTAVFEDVPFGTIEVSETVPNGYGTPLIFCLDTTSDVPGGYEPATVVDGDTASWEHVADSELPTTCLIFNFPEDPNEVEIHKWACPEGFDPNSSDQEFMETCTEAMDGVAFALTTESGVEALDTVDGLVVFGGIGAESIGIQETIPEGFGNPYVICEYDDDEWHDIGESSGFIEYQFTGGGETLVCHWFNLHAGSGDLTIYKWTCPADYDLHAEGADPAADCTEATSGITFQIGRSEAAMIDELQITGDVIDGGVFFDDLESDVYKVAELVPDGIESVFVLECTGHLMGVLQPYPLAEGNELELKVHAGEHLVCHWFNVPESDGGDLTVVKYVCSTEVFVSEVDCEIFEGGQGFEWFFWSGT
jgi:hypothetical protein